MEGWFWRVTDVARGRVVVALCGVNRHPEGDWATLAIAAHPGGVVRSAAAPGATAAADRFDVRVADLFEADAGHVRLALDGHLVDVALEETDPWPLRLGGGGLFSVVPFLGQYWHPHVLGGRVSGVVVVGDERWDLDGATVYAEKNWGRGFPERWWWGQAQGFDDPSVCVAFGGGRLPLVGPLAIDVGGCVVKVGDRVVRFAPPAALVRAHVADGTWRVTARKPGWRLDVEGDGDGRDPHVLPVPLPAERRNVDTDLEHLAGRMHVRLRRGSRTVLDATTTLAGLEVGTRPA